MNKSVDFSIYSIYIYRNHTLIPINPMKKSVFFFSISQIYGNLPDSSREIRDTDNMCLQLVHALR